MEGNNSLRQIKDTVDLLNMLEHLVEGLSQGTVRADEVPWGGIKLTISRGQELLVDFHEQVTQGSFAEPAVGQREPARGGKSSGTSLADRVQQAPTSGSRVRELLNSVAPANTGGRADGATTTREAPASK